MTTFGQKLKELRTENKMSQQKVAKEINFSQSVLCDWENEKAEPTISAVIAIANYFHVSIDELLGREDYATGNVVITGTQLSEDEKQLVDLYRVLTLRDKAELIGFAKGLAY